MGKFSLQVSRKHYFDNYDTLPRFISYFYQIKTIKTIKPKSLLEIGIGNGFVSNYLKNNHFKVKTCDIDKELNPDKVASATKLPFKDSSFDIVMACEVLEHLSWNDTKKAVDEMIRVSKKYIFISVPHASFYWDALFKFPLLGRIGKPFLRIFFSIPFIYSNGRFSNQHYWEIGRKGYSNKKFLSLFYENARLLKSFRAPLNPMHHFFLFEKLS